MLVESIPDLPSSERQASLNLKKRLLVVSLCLFVFVLSICRKEAERGI